MNQAYITNIIIDHVRHLKDIEIPLSENRMKHLIITGKNGSGKTSLLDALAAYLDVITHPAAYRECRKKLEQSKEELQNVISRENASEELEKIQKRVEDYEKCYKILMGDLIVEFETPIDDIQDFFPQGKFVTAYYKADRIFKAQIPQHVEKVALKKDYSIKETPRQDFVKYLLDLKMTQALAVTGGKKEKADQIAAWFQNFDNLLKRIFDDDSVELVFDEETFQFTIHMEGRDPFDFNELSSGYAAVLDIVVDLIIRMESQTERRFDFSVAGIVLIDEIETHLHLELQRKILDLLTSIFPNIQFIMSTHSPFIIQSLEDGELVTLDQPLDSEYSGEGIEDIAEDIMGVVLPQYSEKKRKIYEASREYFSALKEAKTQDEIEKLGKRLAELEAEYSENPAYMAWVHQQYTEKAWKVKKNEGNR